MPAFDKTGPQGQGPLTGRGMGPCGRGLGPRFGRGSGRGLGRYYGWNFPQDPKDRKETLADYRKALEEELEDLKKEEESIK